MSGLLLALCCCAEEPPPPPPEFCWYYVFPCECNPEAPPGWIPCDVVFAAGISPCAEHGDRGPTIRSLPDGLCYWIQCCPEGECWETGPEYPTSLPMIEIGDFLEDCDECCVEPPCYVNFVAFCCDPLPAGQEPGFSATCADVFEAVPDIGQGVVIKAFGYCWFTDWQVNGVPDWPVRPIVAGDITGIAGNCLELVCCPEPCEGCPEPNDPDCPLMTEATFSASYGSIQAPCLCFDGGQAFCPWPPPTFTLCITPSGFQQGLCNCLHGEFDPNPSECCGGVPYEVFDIENCRCYYLCGYTCNVNQIQVSGPVPPPFGIAAPTPGWICYTLYFVVTTSTPCNANEPDQSCVDCNETFPGFQECPDPCSTGQYHGIFQSPWVAPCTCWNEVDWEFWYSDQGHVLNAAVVTVG